MNAISLKEAHDSARITGTAEILPFIRPANDGLTNEELRQKQYAMQKAMYDAALSKMTEEERIIALAPKGPLMQPDREYSDEYVEQASRQENHGSIFCSSFAHCIR